MRSLCCLALLLVACAPKTGPAPAAPAPAPAPEAMAPPPPAPAPAPAPLAHADFDATLTFADGHTRSGHVVGLERGEDWYAEKGWTHDAKDLVLTLDSDDATEDVPWTAIRSIDITLGDAQNPDCEYDSSYQPMMYMCVLRTEPVATTTDGRTWTVATRNAWRFTFAQGDPVTFYVYKIPVRAQDDPQPGHELDENPAMYPMLKQQVLDAAAKAVTRIEVTAPTSP